MLSITNSQNMGMLHFDLAYVDCLADVGDTAQIVASNGPNGQFGLCDGLMGNVESFSMEKWM